MIIGAHVVVASSNPESDQKFFREFLNLSSVDAGGGYIIFGLPASEVSIHQTEGKLPQHQLFFLCEDIDAIVADVTRRGIACSERQDQGWGIVVEVTLPSGAPLNIYQAKHARPMDIAD